MSTVKLGDSVSYEAGEDLSAAQYLFVTLESDGQLDLADATTDEPIGVLQNVPDAAGKEAKIVKGGQTKVVAGEALAVNTIVGTNASGQAVAVSSGVWPCGRVVTAAGASGDVAVIEFFYSSEEIGGSDVFSAISCTGDITLTDNAADADCNDLKFQKIRAAAIVQDGDDLGHIDFMGSNGTTYDIAAQIIGEVNGTPGATTDMPGRIVVLCTPDGSATPGEVVRFASALMTFADAANIAFNTTTGTKIGTAAAQKIGFWNATPVVQPTHNADPAACASLTQGTYTASTTLTDPPTKAEMEAELALIDAELDKIKVDTAAIKTAVDANNAAIDSINADFAETGLTAAA